MTVTCWKLKELFLCGVCENGSKPPKELPGAATSVMKERL